MVVDYEGPVRFSNSAAARLLDAAGQPPEVVLPQLHRAAEVGFSAHPALRIGDRAYAMTARSLPDERAVLAVAPRPHRRAAPRARRSRLRLQRRARAAQPAGRDLRRDRGAAGAAPRTTRSDRDHFLDRLAEDAERMNRLTQSLLTLARVESRGAAESEIVDVPLAIRDVVAACEAPPHVELVVDVESDLAADRRPDAAAPGDDRPAHQRLQEHAAARHRYRSRPP